MAQTPSPLGNFPNYYFLLFDPILPKIYKNNTEINIQGNTNSFNQSLLCMIKLQLQNIFVTGGEELFETEGMIARIITITSIIRQGELCSLISGFQSQIYLQPLSSLSTLTDIYDNHLFLSYSRETRQFHMILVHF